MKLPGHTLVLIPWHIGNRLDVTVNAVRAARRLRVFLVEDAKLTKRQFESDLGIYCREKEFLAIPEFESPRFIKAVRARLRMEDVGLISSGGAPCFIDPGAWLVRRLRSQGVPVVALAGASILSTMLSLSGVDWTGTSSRGTFVFYLGACDPEVRGRSDFQEAVQRARDPVFVFLDILQFRKCLLDMKPFIGKRAITAFFDLTKTPRSKYPYADRLLTMSCRDWLRQAARIRWEDISDVALMVHPSSEEP